MGDTPAANAITVRRCQPPLQLAAAARCAGFIVIIVPHSLPTTRAEGIVDVAECRKTHIMLLCTYNLAGSRSIVWAMEAAGGSQGKVGSKEATLLTRGSNQLSTYAITCFYWLATSVSSE